MGLGEHRVRQSFFDDQPEAKPVSNLGQEIRDDDRFSGARHSKQHTMLRGVTQPGPDAHQIASGAIVNCFRPFQMAGEGRRPWNQIGQIRILGRQIKGSIAADCPTGPGLIKELTSVFRNGGVMHHGAAHRDERIFQGGASGRQLLRLAVPEPDDKKSVQRDNFALLQFGDFFLLSHQIRDQGLFALRNRIDL